MNEWKIVLLTGAVSILTAFFTKIFTHRNEVRKIVLENRASLYFELYTELEIVLNNHLKVFENDYIKILLLFKPKMKLLASKSTIKAFKDFFDFVIEKYSDFHCFCEENDPMNNPEYHKTTCDDYGNEHEIYLGSDFEIKEYEKCVDKYKNDNAPTTKELDKLFTRLYENMRIDLGSNLSQIRNLKDFLIQQNINNYHFKRNKKDR